MAVPSPAHPGPPVDKERVNAQLRKWQERLLDLTKSNPLLGINRSRVSKLKVTRPAASELFKALVLDEAELRMPLVTKEVPPPQQPGLSVGDESPALQVHPGDIEFDAAPIDLMRRLRRIYDNARTTVEERGVTTLYMTFGALWWREDALGESVSPLWMVPCQLVSKGPNAPLRLSLADEEMQLNPALGLYLRERHKVSLPDIPDEPDEGSVVRLLNSVADDVREHRWNVSDEVWLSTFSFESLVIYNDLKVLADEAAAHPIVAVLAHASPVPEHSEALGEDLDSVETPAVVPLPVLPADSSQLEAMTHGASGRSVVIHGPPGTGKSQTISNLIADALGRNKTVLFVSAKMAALNVVYQRLAEKGLGRFCLEAHSTKAGKAKIAEELRRTVESEDDGQATGLVEELETLLHVRRELNSYVRELHTCREPLARSVYQVIGRVAKLDKSADVRAALPWEDVLAVKPHELTAALDCLGELGAHAAVVDNRETHPWRGFVPTKGDLSEQEVVEDDLRRIVASFGELLAELQHLADLIPRYTELALAELASLAPALAAVSRVNGLPTAWASAPPATLKSRATVFDTAAALSIELEHAQSEYGASFTVAVEEAHGVLRPTGGYARWYRRLAPGYWRWRSRVRQITKPRTKLDYESLLRYSRLVSRISEIHEWLAEKEGELLLEVGEARTVPELRAAADRFRAAALLREGLDSIGRVPAAMSIELTAETKKSAAEVAEYTSRQKEALGAISRIAGFWPAGFIGTLSIEQVPLHAAVERCNEILGALPRSREWILLFRILDKCRSLGLTDFISALDKMSASEARATFERRFYVLWASAAMQSSAHLSSFSSLHREELVKKFRTLDERIRQLSAAQVRAVASAQARRVRTAQSNFGANTEVSILRRELQKRKRIKPLRKLFAEIPHALQALKPCMLMSPISVSTYLKPGVLKFDLVVFDEASQLPTAESIPSILRASQVIVAGDRNQLPPTSFFQAAFGIEDEDTEDSEALALEPLESLLDECVAIVPLFQESFLKWHYRSRDERLIKFSNHYFYENRLITFPSVATGADSRGLQLAYVPDGVWDRGRSRTNRQEARQVAKLIIEHFTRHAGRSLGVVAMNAQQREAIEDALNEELQTRPELAPLVDATKPEPFFVKALENVQGDERDVMIISVGYGKDSTGHLTLNFGPINMEGGWRRLNVLVTRAKWQTILVTSLRSHELHGINPNNRGAVALRNFIIYAEQNCRLPQPPAAPTDAETNDFEDAVCAALRERGLSVDQQVGASKFRIDLAIRDRTDPARYVLGIECDGVTYHASRTARDRDLLRQQVLRDMGWRIHRVWSTEWFYDQDLAIEKILRSLAQAETVPPEELVEAPPTADPEPSFQPTSREPVNPDAPATDVHAERQYHPGEPYRKYSRSPNRRNRDLLLISRNIDDLAREVASIVEVEGPIHEDLVADRLKEVLAVERAGSNVQSNIGEAVHRAIRKYDVERRRHKSFLWRRGKALQIFRTPGDGVKRPLELIHRQELELAVLYVVEDQFGTMREELPRVVAKLFGFERTSPDAADIIRDVVDELVDRGLLRESGPQVNLG